MTHQGDRVRIDLRPVAGTEIAQISRNNAQIPECPGSAFLVRVFRLVSHDQLERS